MTQELLSALDVTNRIFRRSLRGYDVAEVDEFLDAVSDTIHIYAERVRECESTIAGLREQMQEYQNLRDSMQEALIMAQKSAEERITAAEQQARTILEDARSKGEVLVQQANSEAEGIRREMKLLREKRGYHDGGTPRLPRPVRSPSGSSGGGIRGCALCGEPSFFFPPLFSGAFGRFRRLSSYPSTVLIFRYMTKRNQRAGLSDPLRFFCSVNLRKPSQKLSCENRLLPLQ